jgi:hypothetical protein
LHNRKNGITFALAIRKLIDVRGRFASSAGRAHPF